MGVSAASSPATIQLRGPALCVVGSGRLITKMDLELPSWWTRSLGRPCPSEDGVAFIGQSLQNYAPFISIFLAAL